MAKRFIDTGLFEDPWFADLSTSGKVLWVYYLTRCDNAGLLKFNKKLMEFQTGIKSIETVIQELGNRLLRVNQELFFCPKFIEFQYPGFPKSKAPQQKGACDLLVKAGLMDENYNYSESYTTVTQDLAKSNGNGKGNIYGKGNGEKPRAKIPEVSEFVQYGLSLVSGNKGYTIPLQGKYESWVANGWNDGYNKPIKDWKAKLKNVITHLTPMAGKASDPLTEDVNSAWDFIENGQN